MRLKQHINEAGGKQLEIDETFELIKKECKSAYASYMKGNYIFRGIGDRVDATYYQGRKGRRSAQTSNFYTLILDNDPKWKKYPKRSESFICSTDPLYAEDFGHAMYVFPKDGFILGVAPEYDFWKSFKTSWDNIATVNILIKTLSNFLDVTINDSSYTAMVGMFKELDKELGNISKNSMPIIINQHPYMKNLLSKYNGDMLKLYQDILDPKKNGFTTTKSLDGSNMRGSHEVWFSGPTYMISKYEMDVREEGMV